ncbi:41 helicase [uncultured Caudovirales phage]|uniref:41 helicase n=1 Tax=uncultured Caudovirales phage TaxID=2100421 RepID=A0A6J5L5X6_9CAUD|nr:41 helicase [uncultured Caudovirales phage]
MSEVVEIPANETLPFFDQKQDAFVGHLLLNSNFFLQVRGKLRHEWLNDPWCSRIVKAYFHFYDRWKRPPTSVDEFKNTLEFLKEDEGTRTRLFAKIAQATMATEVYGLDIIRSELTLWFKAREFKAYIEKASSVFNEASKGGKDLSKLNEAFDLIPKWNRALTEATFEEEEGVSFEDIATGGFFSAQKQELEDALTFGCRLVDRKLNGDCINDCSLLRGDHTILLAPTNIGKTTAMLTTVRHNIQKGRDILFLSHEGRPKDIKSKLLQSVLGKTRAELLTIGDTEDGRKLLGAAARIMTKHVTYIPFARGGATVEDVEGVIRRAQERRIATTGKGYDLIVDDYPAKLMTSMAKGGHWAPRQIGEYVYNFFTAIGLEYNAHVLTAIQTNREGSKVNRNQKGDESRLLTLEDVAETWGAMTTATNVISFNRSPDAQAKNRATFHICKSRSGEIGWSIVTQTRFDVAMTHGDKLKATYYRGTSLMDERIDDLLEQYEGGAVPEHLNHM